MNPIQQPLSLDVVQVALNNAAELVAQAKATRPTAQHVDAIAHNIDALACVLNLLRSMQQRNSMPAELGQSLLAVCHNTLRQDFARLQRH